MTRRRELLKVTRPRGPTPPIIPRPFKTVGFSQVNIKKKDYLIPHKSPDVKSIANMPYWKTY